MLSADKFDWLLTIKGDHTSGSYLVVQWERQGFLSEHWFEPKGTKMRPWLRTSNG
jgi:hypothetical protein